MLPNQRIRTRFISAGAAIGWWWRVVHYRRRRDNSASTRVSFEINVCAVSRRVAIGRNVDRCNCTCSGRRRCFVIGCEVASGVVDPNMLNLYLNAAGRRSQTLANWARIS